MGAVRDFRTKGQHKTLTFKPMQQYHKDIRREGINSFTCSTDKTRGGGGGGGGGPVSGGGSRVFTKETFGISRKSKFYAKMVLFSRHFERFRIFSYYFLYDIFE